MRRPKRLGGRLWRFVRVVLSDRLGSDDGNERQHVPGFFCGFGLFFGGVVFNGL